MPVGDLLEDVRAEPFPEIHHVLLVAGWAEMPALAGKGQQVFKEIVTQRAAAQFLADVREIDQAEALPSVDFGEMRRPKYHGLDLGPLFPQDREQVTETGVEKILRERIDLLAYKIAHDLDHAL